jgi:hypothetical protein
MPEYQSLQPMPTLLSQYEVSSRLAGRKFSSFTFATIPATMRF